MLAKGPAVSLESKKKVDSKKKFQKIWSQKYLWLLGLPAILCLIIFSYAPMTGIYMAFTNYAPSKNGYFHDLLGAQFVGLDWFKYFFSTDFSIVMRNTLGISLITLLISFPAPILIAICLNEVFQKKTKKAIQTASYLPYFISWVIAANIIMTLFSANGIVNDLLQLLHLTKEDILFFQNGKYFWWIMAFANTWKGMGYNAIIYLAAISGISSEQYEAAEIDGASRLQRIIYVTLPSLKPTIMILLILAIGGILNTGFEQILLLQNSSIMNYSDVLDTYAYRYGMQNGMYSYGTAVGLFKSIVSFVLVIGANRITKKMTSQGLF